MKAKHGQPQRWKNKDWLRQKTMERFMHEILFYMGTSETRGNLKAEWSEGCNHGILNAEVPLGWTHHKVHRQ